MFLVHLMTQPGTNQIEEYCGAKKQWYHTPVSIAIEEIADQEQPSILKTRIVPTDRQEVDNEDYNEEQKKTEGIDNHILFDFLLHRADHLSDILPLHYFQ